MTVYETPLYLYSTGVPASSGGGSGGGGLSGGAIAGTVIGVLAGLLLLGVLIWFLLRRRRRSHGDVEMARGKGRKEVPVAAAAAPRNKGSQLRLAFLSCASLYGYSDGAAGLLDRCLGKLLLHY